MNLREFRYVAVAMVLSCGVGLGAAIPLGDPVGPCIFAGYMITFYVTYQNTDWLHRAIQRIANGRERKK